MVKGGLKKFLGLAGASAVIAGLSTPVAAEALTIPEMTFVKNATTFSCTTDKGSVEVGAGFVGNTVEVKDANGNVVLQTSNFKSVLELESAGKNFCKTGEIGTDVKLILVEYPDMGIRERFYCRSNDGKVAFAENGWTSVTYIQNDGTNSLGAMNYLIAKQKALNFCNGKGPK